MNSMIKILHASVLVIVVLASGCGSVDEMAVLSGGGGGGGTDTTPPTVTSTSPANSATNVSAATTITATFSELMDGTTITSTSFTVSGGVTGTVSGGGTTYTFTPSSALAYATTYTATLDATITDFAGNPLAAAYTWTFTTEAAPDTTRPTVSSTVPTSSATGVAASAPISATFSENMNCATITSSSFTVSGGASGNITCSGATATWTPSSQLAYATPYTVTISTAAADLAGNTMLNSYSWSFTTENAPDTTPPTVSSTNPASGATNVRVIGGTVTATFSETMALSSINTGTFTLRETVSGTPVTGGVTYSGLTATFTPLTTLTNNLGYTAIVTNGVTDLAGNPMQFDYPWVFTTTNDTTAPTVSTTTPGAGATLVAVTTDITAVFSESMDCATITTSTFRLEADLNPGVAIPAAINSCIGTTAVLNPTADLAAGAGYTAFVTTSVTDSVGNPLTAIYSWGFSTAP